jgi:hypothetical protein
MSVVKPADSFAAPAEKLESQVRSRLGSRVRDLRIVVRDGGVVLKGWALNYHAKQLAQHAAMEIAEAPILSNEIEVRRAGQQTGTPAFNLAG